MKVTVELKGQCNKLQWREWCYSALVRTTGTNLAESIRYSVTLSGTAAPGRPQHNLHVHKPPLNLHPQKHPAKLSTQDRLHFISSPHLLPLPLLGPGDRVQPPPSFSQFQSDLSVPAAPKYAIKQNLAVQ